jgi:hypothetical protein
MSPLRPTRPVGPDWPSTGEAREARQARTLGRIAPVAAMLGLGSEIPLAVFVVLVLNALMMLLCAVALLSRGGRSA